MTRTLHFGDESRLRMPHTLGQAAQPAASAAPTPATPVLGEQYREVRLDAIVGESPVQTRQAFDPERDDDDRALVESLRADGQRLPILLVEAEAGPGRTFTPLDGHRRLAALRHLGHATVKAVIYRLGTAECDLVTLTANVRKNLTPIEQARAIQRLRERHAFTQDVIAQKAGLSRQYVIQLLALLETDPAVQAALDAGRISSLAARALAEAPREQQADLALVTAASNLSGVEARRLVERVTMAGQSPAEAAEALGLAAPTAAAERPAKRSRNKLTAESARAILAGFLPELDAAAALLLVEVAVHIGLSARAFRAAALLVYAGWEPAEAAGASERLQRTPEMRQVLILAQASADLQVLLLQRPGRPEHAPLLASLIKKLGSVKQAALQRAGA